MLLYHGSPHLFDHFELTGAGKGTGIKIYGVRGRVMLTNLSIASA